MPGHPALELEHGKKQMVSYCLGLTVQLVRSRVCQVQNKTSLCSQGTTCMSNLGGFSATDNKSWRKKHRCVLVKRGRHRVEPAAGESLFLFIRLTDRAEWFASQQTTERSNGNSVTANKDQEPGKLCSSQMDNWVTGHRISQTVPCKTSGWH